MNWTQEMLLALSGELDADRRRRLDEALTRDEALRLEWEKLKRTQTLLAGQQFRVQPYLATRVMARLANARPRWGQAFQQLVMPVLAVILLLLVLTYVQEDGLSFETLSGFESLSVETVAMVEWSDADF